MAAGTAEFLATTDLFAGVPTASLESVASRFKPLSLTGGETLFRRGDPGHSLFLLVSGRLRARLGDLTSAEIGPGEVVGELALVTHEPRSATVTAIRDSVLLSLSQESFDALVEKHPSLMMALTRRIVKRDQEALRGRAPGAGRPAATVALVAAGRSPLPPEFVENLRRALAKHGNTLLLDATQLSRDPEWLNKQESAHRFVLYQAEEAMTPWTNRCLRQADRILFAAFADDAPALGDIERAVLQPGGPGHEAAHELVLLRRGDARPSGTAAWLASRSVARHHHARLGDPGDFDRIARFLTREAVGLVLGGGGARGLAHIGLVRALDEAGIPVDLVGGTSMGAFISAQRAWGMDWKQMLEFNRRSWLERSPLRDYTLPALSVLSGDRFLAAMREYYGETAIEDLPIAYFCMSSNLTMAQAVSHTSGPLWIWMCASMAIPGVAPPTLDAGSLHVDGGVLENVPIGTMRRRHDGLIIAHDVTPRMDLCVDKNVAEIPPSWRLLWNRLNPYHEGPKFPGLFDVLSRVTALGSIRSVEQVKEQASLYLHSPVEGHGIFDFQKMDALVEIGYRHAAEKLASWVPPRG